MERYENEQAATAVDHSKEAPQRDVGPTRFRSAGSQASRARLVVDHLKRERKAVLPYVNLHLGRSTADRDPRDLRVEILRSMHASVQAGKFKLTFPDYQAAIFEVPEQHSHLHVGRSRHFATKSVRAVGGRASQSAKKPVDSVGPCRVLATGINRQPPTPSISTRLRTYLRQRGYMARQRSSQTQEGGTSEAAGAWLTFPKASDQTEVQVKIGISFNTECKPGRMLRVKSWALIFKRRVRKR